jgi:HPt (histidine-containing phosphotransfer) domain-containing protein
MPILALDAIDALHALTAADPAMLDELLDDHVSESARLQAALREAHARGDRDAARASAHSIRGSAATLGAREVAAIAADIEQAILSGRALAETTDYIAELDGALVRARAAFADVRARRRPVA